MNGSMITKVLRVFFGVFMVVVYLGMASMLALNYFDWSNALVWTCVRWFMAVIFGVYGFYRAYRQIKGIDYYRNDRFNETNDDEDDK